MIDADVCIRTVTNGFVVTVGDEINGSPPPQYVARDLDQLCEILREILGKQP